jgi:signal transduction histidine kinase
VRVFPSADDETLFVIRDISAEKHQRDQSLQSQKLEAIGQLAAGIAHEINTPLQFVGDNLHFLAEAAETLTNALGQYRENVTETTIETFNKIDESLDIPYMTEHLKSAFMAALDGVQRVSVIVQAMKSFSHPGPKEKRQEDLNHAIETTLTISTNVWKYVAEIERDFAPDLPKVDCVIGEINQVLLNLITNAAHAIGDVVGESGGKGVIRISTRYDSDCIVVRISDSGGGMPEAVQKRVFEPFFTTKPVGRGTGQGLPLARSIILQHRGSLEFETQQGVGTTFTIRLPIAQTNSLAPKV